MCMVVDLIVFCVCFFFFKQKTAYELRISDWSSDVCSSDLLDRLAIITLIIDRQTKLILGHALMASYGGGEEIRLALDDFGKRIRDFAKTDLSTATRIQGVVWVAARDIEIFADLVTSERFHEINRPTVEVIDTGPRRHGTEILRWLGDRLPPLSFKPMAMERFESASSEHGIPIDEARSEEHTSELQSLMRNSYAVFCLKKKSTNKSLIHHP